MLHRLAPWVAVFWETREDRDMSRERIEERVRGYFGSEQTALAAALSEVQVCFAFPESLAAVQREIGPAIPVEKAVVQWAIIRGRQWA
jgi:hypothetical protein